jgi:hypothetical protein
MSARISAFFASVITPLLLITSCDQTLAQTLVPAPERFLGKLRYGDVPAIVATITANETFVISYISFRPTDFSIRLIQPVSPTEGGTSLYRFMQDNHPAAVMNGGFVDTNSPATPSGFLMIGSKILNRISLEERDRVLDGFLCFVPKEANASAIVIGPIVDLEKVASEYEDCVQGGPLVILDSKPLSQSLQSLDKDQNLTNFASIAAARSFVATTKTGEIVMGVTSPVSLYSLTSILVRERLSGGFEVSRAIALTGRSTSGLIAGSAFARGNTNSLLPDAIIVRNY